jgi:hypothetical protein
LARDLLHLVEWQTAVHRQNDIGEQLVAGRASPHAFDRHNAFNLVGTTKSEVTTMAPRQLSTFSPHLKSAYRNGRGDGALLIGHVDATWNDLTPRERSVAALEMRDRLLAENVQDAMIYDSKRRLQIHLASGELRRPAIVAGARSEENTSSE